MGKANGSPSSSASPQTNGARLNGITVTRPLACAQSDHMVMIQVVNKPFVPSERKPERPEDWLDADIRYTGKTEIGYIVEPFTAELKFYVQVPFSFFTNTHDWHSLTMGVLGPQEAPKSAVKVTDPEVQ